MDDSDRWVIIDESGKECYESEVYRVIATPEQIGWVYNEGPPHDHNYDFVDSRFLEVVHPRVFIDCVKNDFKITIVVDETCIPKSDDCRGESMLIPYLHDGKVIIDGYGILKKSPSVFVY